MGTISVKKEEKVLKMTVAMAAQQNEIYLMPLTNTLKNDQNGKILLCILYHTKKSFNKVCITCLSKRCS